MDNLVTGVENVNVADSQQTNVESNQIASDVQTNTGVETTGAADQQQNNGFEQAFARRLAQERQRMEQEYTNKYSKYTSLVENTAKQYNMSTEEYLNAIEQQQKESERQRYIQQGVNPDLVSELIKKDPVYSEAQRIVQEQQRKQEFNQEASALFNAFPNLTPGDIPKEVFQLKEQTGMPLLYAYKSFMFDNVKRDTEQQVISKMQTNASASVGSVGGGATHDTSIKSMGKEDFSKLLEKVKRGEIRNL